MKNIKLLLPLIVAGVLAFYAIGCGSNATGGGSGGGSATSGKLVDPYIEGAWVYVDVNGSGSWDAGEPSTETGSGINAGRFTFTTAPTSGAFIRILYQGTHLGITYDADLARQVDSSGNLNISPLTTMLANGISAEGVYQVLHQYAGIDVNKDQLTDDPMSGLNLNNGDSIGNIRGAICVYCLMKIVSNETSVDGGYFDIASIEGNAGMLDGLDQMGTAVKGALTPTLLTDINGTVETIRTTVNGNLSSFGLSANIPNATATDVADTAFTITTWVMEHAIAHANSNPQDYDPGAAIGSIEGYAGRLGIRYYLLNNRDHVVFNIPSGFGGPGWPSGQYTFQSLVDRGMIEDQVGTIATGEISSTVEGYEIDYGTGDIVPVY